jgi:phosphate transport system permease protein
VSTQPPDPVVSKLFHPDRRLRRRKIVNRLMEGIALLASFAAVAVLVIVVVSVLRRGWSALSIDFFTKGPGFFGATNGGIADAIVGSVIIVALAMLFAVPIGVAIAIFVSELAPRPLANAIRLALDVINGVPTIVTGVFIFTVIVLAQGQSGWAAAMALAIIALPLVARSTQEVLRLVPTSLREAGLALGASRWRTVLGIVLPTSLGGILTGATLAVARIAGETAPILFTSSLTANVVDWHPSHPLMTIPLKIFELSDSPDPADHARAWAAGIVLLGFVLVTSLVSKAILARQRRKLSR